ncbi:DUF3291 domain-containing protein [Actinocorallia longicatena]|uniref:DUF3291 domain-containing protein n=1 Tax=Actinocorallia longicatena TaxID=111803 RepID=A0ABP6QB83_9ACTN
MPTIPWITVEQPSSAEVLVMASRLEVKALHQVPGFLLASMRLLLQARRSPGALGVSLKAEPFARTFWTLSAWTDQKAVNAYAAAEPHRSTMRAKRAVMKDSTFVFWTAPATGLPLSWEEAHRRIEAERA